MASTGHLPWLPATRFFFRRLRLFGNRTIAAVLVAFEIVGAVFRGTGRSRCIDYRHSTCQERFFRVFVCNVSHKSFYIGSRNMASASEGWQAHLDFFIAPVDNRARNEIS